MQGKRRTKRGQPLPGVGSHTPLLLAEPFTSLSLPAVLSKFDLRVTY